MAGGQQRVSLPVDIIFKIIVHVLNCLASMEPHGLSGFSYWCLSFAFSRKRIVRVMKSHMDDFSYFHPYTDTFIQTFDSFISIFMIFG